MAESSGKLYQHAQGPGPRPRDLQATTALQRSAPEAKRLRQEPSRAEGSCPIRAGYSPSTYRMLGPSVLFTYAVRLVLTLGRVAGGDDAYTAVFACTRKPPST